MKPCLLSMTGVLLVLGIAGVQAAPQNPKALGYFDISEERAMMAATNERLRKCALLRSQGIAALQKNDLRKAEALLKQALSVDPTDPESSVRLAQMHMRSKQPAAVITDLDPIVNPKPGSGNSEGSAITTRMLYVLAQLDCGNWEAAATCYQKSYRHDQTWLLPYGGPVHPFPNIPFTPENPDFSGLRAQAHLILGGCLPSFFQPKDAPPYRLEQLRQALKYNPKSLDATYLSGFMLGKMERFAEARQAYEKALRLASKEVRPEIQQSLEALKEQEDAKWANDHRL